MLLLLSACNDSTLASKDDDPVVTLTAPAEGQVIAEGEPVRLVANVHDDGASNDQLTYAWTSDLAGTLDGEQVVTDDDVALTVEGLIAGTHVVTLYATDPAGHTGADTVTFTIAPDERPSITLTSPIAGTVFAPDAAIRVQATVADPDEDDPNLLALTWTGVAEGDPGAPAHPNSDGSVDFYVTNPGIGAWNLGVEVTDSLGATASASTAFEVAESGHPSDVTFDLGDADRTWHGLDTAYGLGRSVCAGDLDADGLDDLVVGSVAWEGSSPFNGAVYVLHGPLDGDSRSTSAATIVADAKYGFGIELACRADWTGDGAADILVGAVGYPDGHTGAPGAALFFASPLSGEVAAGEASTVLEGIAGDYFGASIDDAGDLNGDGYHDVVVGAYQRDGGAGAAVIFYGPITDATNADDAAVEFSEPTLALGWDVAGMGDTDGDGRDDLAVSTPYDSTMNFYAGAVWLFRGPIEGTLDSSDASLMIAGLEQEAYTGYSVASIGDTDGDGFGEILFGAWWDDRDLSEAGAAYVFDGDAVGSLDVSDASAHFYGEASGDHVGTAVASAGDVDGDGVGDLLIGAPGNDTAGESTGSVYLAYGPVAGEHDLAEPDVRFVGETADDGIGLLLTHGDFDGDTLGDVVIAAPTGDVGLSEQGGVYVVFGSTVGAAW